MKRIINRLEENILAILLAVMVSIVFAEVIARKMGVGIHWAQELTLILNAWFVLLGASYCVRKNAHICVDFLVEKMPQKYGLICSSIAIVCCIIYSVMFFYGSWIYVAKLKRFNLQLQDIPAGRWIAASCLLVGFGLLIIRFLQALYLVIVYKKTGVLRQVSEAEESMELAESIKREEFV